jgi:hypothetical protein
VRAAPRRLCLRLGEERAPRRRDRAAAQTESTATGQPARRFAEFRWSTLDSWSRRRRVVAKAEWTGGEANPRFIVTSLKAAECERRKLYEEVYCARGEMENRIKECQGDLFADRTSAATMKANQLRLWFASMAYVLLCALRRLGLRHTHFAEATCGTIRLKLLKIGALVRVSVRRIKVAMASGCPYQLEYALALLSPRRADEPENRNQHKTRPCRHGAARTAFAQNRRQELAPALRRPSSA